MDGDTLKLRLGDCTGISADVDASFSGRIGWVKVAPLELDIARSSSLLLLDALKAADSSSSCGGVSVCPLPTSHPRLFLILPSKPSGPTDLRRSALEISKRAGVTKDDETAFRPASMVMSVSDEAFCPSCGRRAYGEPDATSAFPPCPKFAAEAGCRRDRLDGPASEGVVGVSSIAFSTVHSWYPEEGNLLIDFPAQAR